MKSPFQFLDAYTLADKDKFFGREEEVKQLFKLVNQNRLTLVYGQSGTGKTSLVQCGLASRFKAVDWYPLFVRRGEDLNASLRNSLAQTLEAEVDESLPETIEEIFALHLRPVYLIFDQFEELFILGDLPEQTAFFQAISEIVHAKLPCRIILIMREEYLAHLYEFERHLPTILDGRLRVELMGFQKIGEVIRQSCQQFNITLENPAANTTQIIANLKGKKTGIQLPYLQVYLDLFYREDYARTYPNGTTEVLPPLEFTGQEIIDFGAIENVLQRFLQEQERFIQEQLQVMHQAIPPNAVRRVLDVFVTAEGTKRPIAYTQSENDFTLEAGLQRLVPIQGQALQECLDALENSRLLRSDESAYELAHDSLAALIEEERSGEQRQLNEALINLQSSYRLHRATGEYLSQKQLTKLEPFLERLSLDAQEQKFVADSEKHLRRNRRRTIALVTGVILALSGLTLWAVLNALTVKRSARTIVENLLVSAQPDILNLDYEAAQQKYRDAAALKVNEPAVGAAMMEIAYFYAESGQFQRAIPLLDTLRKLYSKRGLGDVGRDTLVDLRGIFQNLDRNRYDTLKARYYPEMVLVAGGTAQFPYTFQLDTFQMAKTETTNWQFHLFIEDTGYDNKAYLEVDWSPLGLGDRPAVRTNWYDAVSYANWVSRQWQQEEVYNIDTTRQDTINNLSDHDDLIWTVIPDSLALGYRLPTAAEWEYAARSGIRQDTFDFSGSDSLALVGWYNSNSNSRPHAVAGKLPNQLELYDMSGNAWEWCWDWYSRIDERKGYNPRGPDKGSTRVFRGGGWSSYERYCRVSDRGLAIPDYRSDSVGFRLVRSL